MDDTLFMGRPKRFSDHAEEANGLLRGDRSFFDALFESLTARSPVVLDRLFRLLVFLKSWIARKYSLPFRVQSLDLSKARKAHEIEKSRDSVQKP